MTTDEERTPGFHTDTTERRWSEGSYGGRGEPDIGEDGTVV